MSLASLTMTIPPLPLGINTARPKAFQIMPVELNQKIAHYLDNDKDLVSFRACCRQARDSVDDQDSFWHRRFRMTYDLSRDKAHKPGNSLSLRRSYQKRKNLMRDGISFSKGTTRKEKEVIALIIDMFRESYEGGAFPDENDLATCNNLEAIWRFAKRTNLLDVLFMTGKDDKSGKIDFRLNQDFVAVQLMLAPMVLDCDDYKRPYNFIESQRIAYTDYGHSTIWKNNTIELDLEYLLHLGNFFKHHMVGDDMTLRDPMQDLDLAQRPQFWKAPLTNTPKKLGNRWMGTYAYLDRDEMAELRSGNPNRALFMDKNVDHGESAIQSLVIDFDSLPEFEWPELFEQILKSQTLPPPAHSHAQHRSTAGQDEDSRCDNEGLKSYQFQAYGYDDEDFLATGWINQLPAQRGIPGWQRISMIKYFRDDSNDGGFDANALWAYEGIVLPGGQIILGRWWSPDDDIRDHEKYTGPFIFWNVDASTDPLVGMEEYEEALRKKAAEAQ
ncbi:hypothetical protein HDK77DRAFT_506945 [Phyllosticta capitalensis]